MLNETPQEKGVYSGCLWSLIFGGGIGGVLGYYLAGFYAGKDPDPNMFMFIRFGFALVGSCLGCVLLGSGQWCYGQFFKKKREEEEI